MHILIVTVDKAKVFLLLACNKKIKIRIGSFLFYLKQKTKSPESIGFTDVTEECIG